MSENVLSDKPEGNLRMREKYGPSEPLAARLLLPEARIYTFRKIHWTPAQTVVEPTVSETDTCIQKN